jgi:hypothetical protein
LRKPGLSFCREVLEVSSPPLTRDPSNEDPHVLLERVGEKTLGMTETLFAILPSDDRESRSLWHKPPRRGEWAVSVCQSNSRNKRSGKKAQKGKALGGLLWYTFV